MNLNDWQQMTPRERDALVATAVMGVPQYIVAAELRGMALLAGYDENGRQITANEKMPNYTKDITAAFLVADEIDLLDKWGCAKFLGCDGGTWFVGELRDGQMVYYATAETAPRAICLAALKAIGVIE